MKPIIEVNQISKKYLIDHQPSAVHTTLVETLSRKLKSLFSKRHSSSHKHTQEEFWALSNVTFALHQGDRIGVIGRNGAGKSTLLKILSRITTPTLGSIKVRGRVSSLLEVGTGFHPELTGRENIYLNGAILGMSRREIQQKFDQIVDFAEVEKFLDTPVKRFSSGMHMRLGFGIAAHLDPDVLIVDEVLAVGDVRFQEKCLNKLDHLSQHGRTVIFVSHDMGAVSRLCNKGLFLEAGSVKHFGPIEECMTAYIQNGSHQTSMWEGDIGDEHIHFHRMSIITPEKDRTFFYQDEPIRLEIDYEIFISGGDPPILGVGVWNQRGHLLAKSYTMDNHQMIDLATAPGKQRLAFTIPAVALYEGEYFVKLECFIHNKKVVLKDQLMLKLAIYPPRNLVRFLNHPAMTGAHLGTQWQLL